MNTAEKAATKIVNNLKAHIHAQIDLHDGKISFAEFMQLALYTPGLGYYSAAKVKFGAHGDFITAPEIGNLFAQCLAVQCAQILPALKYKNIIEFGAGSGRLACDLLRSLDKLNISIDHYYIIEISTALRAQQQALILQQCPHIASRVQWLDQLPASIDAVIIANEVLDAMPVHRFHYDNGILYEYFVTIKNDEFAYILDTPSNALNRAIQQSGILPQINAPYTSELNLVLFDWIKALNASLNSGAVLLFDYGFPRAEFYHPQRNTGTLMCHYQQQCNADPFLNVGTQDITAHVDFTHVAEAADACGLEVAGFTNQASFLLNCGLTEIVARDPRAMAGMTNILTSPAEMGELFKAIALSKNLNVDLLGFRQFDRRHRL